MRKIKSLTLLLSSIMLLASCSNTVNIDGDEFTNRLDAIKEHMTSYQASDLYISSIEESNSTNFEQNRINKDKTITRLSFDMDSYIHQNYLNEIKEERTPETNTSTIRKKNHYYFYDLENDGMISVSEFKKEYSISKQYDELHFQDYLKKMMLAKLKSLTNNVLDQIMKFDDPTLFSPFKVDMNYGSYGDEGSLIVTAIVSGEMNDPIKDETLLQVDKYRYEFRDYLLSYSEYTRSSSRSKNEMSFYENTTISRKINFVYDVDLKPIDYQGSDFKLVDTISDDTTNEEHSSSSSDSTSQEVESSSTSETI